MKIYLRKAKISDSIFFLNLRNKNKENFIDTNIIQFKKHDKWFKKSLKKKNYYFFKIIFSKKDCGYIRLKKTKNNYLVSLCIDKKYRKKNLALQGLNKIENEIPKNSFLNSIVKKNNIASKRLFLKSGYSVYKTDKKLIFMRKKNNKLKIIDQIEKIRKNNNVNWMNLLRLAYKKSPGESALIMSKIYKDDEKISKLVKKLIQN